MYVNGKRFLKLMCGNFLIDNSLERAYEGKMILCSIEKQEKLDESFSIKSLGLESIHQESLTIALSAT